MHLPFHLALRHYRHMVTLMRVPDRRDPVLGVSYPDDTDPRQQSLAQWEHSAVSPRQQESATIDRPLDTRTQSILSYRLEASTRQALNGWPHSDTDRDKQPGTHNRLPIRSGQDIQQVDSRRKQHPCQHSSLRRK